MSFDIADLPSHFSAKLPVRAISAFIFLVGTFLVFAWLGRIVPALVSGSAPVGLESYTTLIIQALDLGIIVPVAFLSGGLLLRRKSYGYLLATVILIKGFTMLIAITAMAINMLLVGAPVARFELVMFPTFALVNIIMVILLMRSIQE